MKTLNPILLHLLLIAGFMLSILAGCSGEPEHHDVPQPIPPEEIEAFNSSIQPRIDNVDRQLADLNKIIERDTDTLNVSNLKDLLRLEIEANRLKTATREIGEGSYATFKNRRNVLERQWNDLEADIEAFKLRLMQEFQNVGHSVEARLNELSLELLDVERYTRSLSPDDETYYNLILAGLKEKHASLDLQHDSLTYSKLDVSPAAAMLQRRNRLIDDITELGADIRLLISELRQTESDITQLSPPTY